MDRRHILQVFHKYNQSPSLLRHAVAVEAVMRWFAAKEGFDPEYWGAVGLLHDIDYERYPEDHCRRAVTILEEEGFDADFIHAVVSHGWGICTELAPEHRMEKVLYAVDELTGLIAAACVLLPSKSVADLKLSSLKKKWKDKKFAAGVNREVVQKGCELIKKKYNNKINYT
ncbi:MAG: HDIG domain-containing protein, partial [Planctomycetes bacterium]|nr:HDIG domain-containing protein [Planctomycetota bacterium]